MGKKGMKKSKKWRAVEEASGASSGASSGKYATHVKVAQYRGKTVRVYGDAVPGQDPLYEDARGAF
jgi:hypothetical protein